MAGGKFKVVHAGVNATVKDNGRIRNKPVEVGTIFELEDDEELPGFMVGKVVEITDEGETVAVTNPAEDPVVTPQPPAAERQALMAEAAKLLADVDFTQDGEPKIDALNEQITDETIAKFTSEERAAIWPGVKDQVMAARST